MSDKNQLDSKARASTDRDPKMGKFCKMSDALWSRGRLWQRKNLFLPRHAIARMRGREGWLRRENVQQHLNKHFLLPDGSFLPKTASMAGGGNFFFDYLSAQINLRFILRDSLEDVWCVSLAKRKSRQLQRQSGKGGKASWANVIKIINLMMLLGGKLNWSWRKRSVDYSPHHLNLWTQFPVMHHLFALHLKSKLNHDELGGSEEGKNVAKTSTFASCSDVCVWCRW